MHLAIVIESSYSENTQLTELPGAHASAELVSSSLKRAGFVVERVPATRELASYLDERLLGAATPFQSLLVYYTGYAALNPERGPALLLDGPRLRAFPVSRVGRSIMTAAYSGALIVDAVAVMEPGQTAEDIADAIAEVVPREGRVSTFAAAREPRNARTWMPSRLSDLFVIGLDWFEVTGAEPSAVTLRSLLGVMQDERLSYSLIGATAEHLPREDFSLLPGRMAARPSAPVRRVDRDLAAESEPMTSWAPSPLAGSFADAPLPSFDDHDATRPLDTDIHAVPEASPLPSFEAHRVDAEQTDSDGLASLPSFDDGYPEHGLFDGRGAMSSLEDRALGSDESIVQVHPGRAAEPLTDADSLHALDSLDDDEAPRADSMHEDVEDVEDVEDDSFRADSMHDASVLRADSMHDDVEDDNQDDDESDSLPSFDVLRRGAGSLDAEESVERSSVLPTPAGRRELASRPERELTDPDALAALVAEYDREGQHDEAIATREQLARCLVGEPTRRAFILEEAARTAANRLGDTANAVRLAREALDVDPTSLGALDVAATELGRDEAWQDLADVYERVLLRLADGPIAARIASHLGTLLQTHLGNSEGALHAFVRALGCDPNDASLHRKLAEIHEGRGDLAAALAHRRAEAKAAPATSAPYAAAASLFASIDDVDGAWNAASVLVALDAADDDARAVYDAYRDNGLLQVQRGLTPGDWNSGLLNPERDEDVAELFRVLTPAACRVRSEQLARVRALPELPDSARHDPEKSTAMLARSLLWTSKLLGVETPALYVMDGAPGNMTAAPLVTRTSIVSRALASGLSLGELSFLWSRHLTFHHDAYRLAAFFPTTLDLANLVVAAKAVGSPETRSIDFLTGETKDLAKALRKAMDEDAFEKLAERCRSLSPDGLAARAVVWARGVELVAGRVGLLACGDVAIASNLVMRFPQPGLLSPREQGDDLLSYAISDEYGELRSRLGAQVSAHAQSRAG
ncbi:MAG TPA: tetratricopeptide repeat protein [Polyangiaceae bacterium]|nr:tetratricopeptide repeat protein [Polyangiaceae bacterium]